MTTYISSDFARYLMCIKDYVFHHMSTVIIQHVRQGRHISKYRSGSYTTQVVVCFPIKAKL